MTSCITEITTEKRDETIEFAQIGGFSVSGAHALMPRVGGVSCGQEGVRMHALREESPVEDDFMRLEPRIARIEGEVTQLNSRAGRVELDLREMRTSMDQKLDKLDAKVDTLFEKLDAKMDALFGKLDAKMDTLFGKLDTKVDVLFGKLDAKMDGVDAKLDAKIDGVDAKLERKLDAMSTRRFTLLVTLISAAATLAAAALAVVYGAAHLH